MSVKGIVVALAVPALTLAAGAARAENLVQNGGFEASSYSSSNQFGTGFGGEGVTDWTAGGGYQVYFFYSTATTTSANSQWGEPQILSANFTPGWPAGRESAFVGLDADSQYDSPLSQTISGLTVGKSYDVSFNWGSTQLTNRSGATTEKVQVSLSDGVNIQSHTTPTDHILSQGFSGWHDQTFAFTATSPTEVLSFLAKGTPNGLPPFVALDGVSMSAAPEPAAWALMIVGLGGLGAAARMRRKAEARPPPAGQQPKRLQPAAGIIGASSLFGPGAI